MMTPLQQRPDHGTISQIDYNLNDIHTFYHDRLGHVNYCIGRLTYTNETYLDVTFVFYDNLNSAQNAFLNPGRINHDRVVRSWVLSQDENIYFVAFDRFDRFLQRNELSFQTRSDTVPGNPSRNVQLHILELTDALKYMQSRGLSSSFLADDCGYVWCGAVLKIFMVDRWFHSYDNVHAEMWSWMLTTDISRFGYGIREYILLNNNNVRWTQKDSFVRCFDPVYIDIRPAVRLDMISQHPFLKDDMEEILQKFSTVQRALVERSFHGYDIDRILNTIKDTSFFVKICPKRVVRLGNEELGYVDVFSTEFLLKWIRNQYEHCRDNYRDVSVLYMEVIRECPLLLPLIHEAIFQAHL